MAGFEGGCAPDPNHCREIAFGSSAVPEAARTFRSKTDGPIIGLFDPVNLRRGAVELRGIPGEIHVLSAHADGD